jgi:hypothetical protein
MNQETAHQSEHCPFCRTQINEGATVCVGCGAYKGQRKMEGALWSNLSWYFPIWAAPFVLGPLAIIWAISESWIVGVIMLIVIWLGYRMFRKGWRHANEVAWIRRQ